MGRRPIPTLGFRARSMPRTSAARAGMSWRARRRKRVGRFPQPDLRQGHRFLSEDTQERGAVGSLTPHAAAPPMRSRRLLPVGERVAGLRQLARQGAVGELRRLHQRGRCGIIAQLLGARQRRPRRADHEGRQRSGEEPDPVGEPQRWSGTFSLWEEGGRRQRDDEGLRTGNLKRVLLCWRVGCTLNALFAYLRNPSSTPLGHLLPSERIAPGIPRSLL